MDRPRYTQATSISDLWILFWSHWSNTRTDARAAVNSFRETVAILENHFRRPANTLKVLEVGCGQRYKNILLFSAAGVDITGGDLEPVGPGVAKFIRMYKVDGFIRVIKSLFRSLFFDRIFYRTMEKHIGMNLGKRGLRILEFDASALPFSDKSFDAVISFDVFEHLRDINMAVSEINRVLKPEGICVVSAHLFPSISGGHQYQWQGWQEKPPKNMIPWGHIRGGPVSGPVFLNKLKRSDYERIFNELMVIGFVKVEERGEELLDKAVIQETQRNGYSRSDLLETKWQVIAYKRS